MTTLSKHENLADAQLIASPMGLIDPEDFKNQSGHTDGPFAMEDGDENVDDELDDEPLDEDGDPTGMPDQGEHDHQQDDNYALGGHVTRSSGA